MKHLLPFILCLTFAAPASASVTIASPSNGETLTSPFTLSADATTCSSQTVSTMAYSLDSGSDLASVDGTSMDMQVSAAAGAHTVHVKAWGDAGAVCVTDVSVTVTGADADADHSVVSSPDPPSNALRLSSLQALSNWKARHDTGGAGKSSGSTTTVGSPSHSGRAREFVSSYKDGGDERYDVNFGDDRTSTNFLYDAWVYLTSSSGHIANLEMDLNQTMPNGWTVTFGFQCDGYSGTWDYTENRGTPEKPKDHWLHSRAACNPRKWSINTWHHVQIEYSRNDDGKVTYQAVWFDGVKSTLNVTVMSAFALHWGPTLVTNLEVDGLGSSGSSTVYLDDLIVYRW